MKSKTLGNRFRGSRFHIAAGFAPITLLVVTVTLIPSISAFGLSLFDTHYMNVESFVGLDNFIRFFTRLHAWRVIGNTLVFVIFSLVLAIPLGLVFALLLNRDIAGRALFRSALIVPYVIAQIVIALMWRWMLDPRLGPIGFLLQGLGFGMVDFIGNPHLAMPTVIVAAAWRSYPLALILILSALQAIPTELTESAVIDGATSLQILRRITIPLIGYAIAIAAVLLTLELFAMVTLIWVLTGGGPLGTTETLGVRVFIQAFQVWNLAMAAAVGVMIVFANGVFGYFYIRVIYTEVDL